MTKKSSFSLFGPFLLLSLFVYLSCQSEFSTNFLVTVKGETEDKLDSFNLVNNTGTMTISGVEYVALAYWTQVMDTFFAGDVWWINVVGIALDGSNLAIVYVDCTNGTLQSDYWEEDWHSFLASKVIKQEYVGASCFFQPNTYVSIPVSFPPLTAIPSTPINTGISISSSSNLISFSDNGGWIIYENKNFTIIPISTVNCFNCASNCGNYSATEQSSGSSSNQPNTTYGCPPGPWYEIHHAAVYEETICFGIFYLFRTDHSFVQWNYTFCAPEVDSPMELYFADWSGHIPHNPPSPSSSLSHPPFLSSQRNVPLDENNLKNVRTNNNNNNNNNGGHQKIDLSGDRR